MDSIRIVRRLHNLLYNRMTNDAHFFEEYREYEFFVSHSLLGELIRGITDNSGCGWGRYQNKQMEIWGHKVHGVDIEGNTVYLARPESIGGEEKWRIELRSYLKSGNFTGR